MDFLFGSKKKPQEILRQNQRALNKAVRELDREQSRLETQEKKIVADIKIMGKKGEIEAVKIMAKDVVKTRRFIKKFILMKANIQAMSLQIQTLKSNNEMAQAMKGVTGALASMNRQIKLPEIQKIMSNFEKESEIVDMKQEIMEESIDEVTGEMEDDEESENLANKILDELGISVSNEVGALPTSNAQLKSSKESTKIAQPEVGDLESRLARLHKE